MRSAESLRVVWLWLALMGALVAAVAASTSLGRLWGQVQPLARLGLQSCGKLPCFLGIVPGITTQAEARTILTAQGGQDFGTEFVLPVQEMESHIGYAERVIYVVVSSVPDSLSTPTVPLATILQQYGLPCGVALSQTNDLDTVMLVYPFVTAEIEVKVYQRRLRIDSPTRYIALGDHTAEARNMCTRNAGQLAPWLGFTTLDRYMAHGLTVS